MGRVPTTPRCMGGSLHQCQGIIGPIPAPYFLLCCLPHSPNTGVGERSQVAGLDGEEAG